MEHFSRRGMLRLTGAGLLTFAAAGSLAACGSTAVGSTGGDGATGKITVWSWTSAAAALRGVVPDFEKNNPGITVDVQDIGNPAIWDKITVGMAAGGQGLADVLHIGCDYLPGYMEKFPGGLADLAKYGANDHKADFVQGLWPTVTGKDGGIYALPWEVNPLGFFYRQDFFKKAGIDPTAFKTWDDVIAAGPDFKAANPDASMIAIDKPASGSPDLDFFQSLLQLQGAFYFTLDGQITLGSDKAIAAMTIIKKLNDAGLVGDAAGEHGWSRLVGANKVGIAPYPAWAADYLATKFPDQTGKWRLAQPPAVTAGGKRAAIVNSTNLAIAGSSPNKMAAWKFIQYALTTPAAMNTMFKSGGVFPALTSAYTDPVFSQPETFYGGQEVLKTFTGLLAEGADATNYSGDYARALKLVSDAQVKVFLKNGDPATVLKDAAAQLAQQTGRKIA
ncbi:ABC transporter substrate-binding protein [Arthrobacter sp. B2a2-09]|uniref:ABC transporter substrate-binding protein n=1 Tax=Arthrobacter sp. B2a2-09 TaxID=2952822 RepID=UPI0022CD4D82|nr:ABC transporter substrate-binding protein [Arthrobacter sp. B2a2-09]MCZ9880268.1 ABC transporter substrate-binding protein [Arthrobacter sp. B2a2-09]